VFIAGDTCDDFSCGEEQPSSAAPATGGGTTGPSKDKAQASVSFEYLHQCLEAIGQRVETLMDITAGYPAHVVLTVC
jgi:hypothetical protein